MLSAFFKPTTRSVVHQCVKWVQIAVHQKKVIDVQKSLTLCVVCRGHEVLSHLDFKYGLLNNFTIWLFLLFLNTTALLSKIAHSSPVACRSWSESYNVTWPHLRQKEVSRELQQGYHAFVEKTKHQTWRAALSLNKVFRWATTAVKGCYFWLRSTIFSCWSSIVSFNIASGRVGLVREGAPVPSGAPMIRIKFFEKLKLGLTLRTNVPPTRFCLWKTCPWHPSKFQHHSYTHVCTSLV